MLGYIACQCPKLPRAASGIHSLRASKEVVSGVGSPGAYLRQTFNNAAVHGDGKKRENADNSEAATAASQWHAQALCTSHIKRRSLHERAQ